MKYVIGLLIAFTLCCAARAAEPEFAHPPKLSLAVKNCGRFEVVWIGTFDGRFIRYSVEDHPEDEAGFMAWLESSDKADIYEIPCEGGAMKGQHRTSMLVPTDLHFDIKGDSVGNEPNDKPAAPTPPSPEGAPAPTENPKDTPPPPSDDDTMALILMTLVNGDLYSKVIQMPDKSSRKDCLGAGAQWLATQKSAESPQYLCVLKSHFHK